jgi:hypothetical protein
MAVPINSTLGRRPTTLAIHLKQLFPPSTLFKDSKLEAPRHSFRIQGGISSVTLDNMGGHKNRLKACDYYHNIITHKQVKTDSIIKYYYQYLTRGYNSIQNKSGYESLKSSGLELIKDDSLRIEIIKLYEQRYSSIIKLE